MGVLSFETATCKQQLRAKWKACICTKPRGVKFCLQELKLNIIVISIYSNTITISDIPNTDFKQRRIYQQSFHAISSKLILKKAITSIANSMKGEIVANLP